MEALTLLKDRSHGSCNVLPHHSEQERFLILNPSLTNIPQCCLWLDTTVQGRSKISISLSFPRSWFPHPSDSSVVILNPIPRVWLKFCIYFLGNLKMAFTVWSLVSAWLYSDQNLHFAQLLFHLVNWFKIWGEVISLNISQRERLRKYSNTLNKKCFLIWTGFKTSVWSILNTLAL